MYQISASHTTMLIPISMRIAFIPPLKAVGFRRGICKQVRPSHAEARPFEGCGGRKAEGCGLARTIGELDGRCYYDWCVGRRKKNLAATLAIDGPGVS